MRPASFASSTSLHPRHVAPRLVFASEPRFTSPRECRVQFADHSITPRVEQRRPEPIEPERVRDSVPKPRSRRCFVCGTTGMHPLDFRICPRTAVLLHRSLAKINDDGRLVSIDGSPLPLTRHPGGVAAHLISRFRNPTYIVPEPPNPARAPIAHTPPRPVSVESRDHVPSSPREFDSSSPHAIPPLHHDAPTAEHTPQRRFTSPFDHVHHGPSDVLSRARALWIGVLLDSLLNSVFRSQLCAIVSLVDGLGVQDPSTLRQRMQPVFMRFSHFIPAT
ncbi:hypothetical protein MVEN_00075600 [Mycena venus]|uniref:Uncharacterized protein n=1 Tax=Mycena venus TaxID=2733690 RepID=A0A8H6Z3Z8_9AGAR|nr:hypothetical protein MVEN_00075600 [Mycena venus]